MNDDENPEHTSEINNSENNVNKNPENVSIQIENKEEDNKNLIITDKRIKFMIRLINYNLIMFLYLLPVFMLDIHGVAYSMLLVVSFGIFYLLMNEIYSFLKLILMFNFVYLYWVNSFIFFFLGYCCTDIYFLLFIGLTHILLTALALKFKNIWIVCVLFLIEVLFPVNNPIYLGMGESYKRLTLSMCIFYIEYAFNVLNNNDKNFTNWISIVVTIPIFKTPWYLCYVYFVAIASYRIFYITYLGDSFKSMAIVVFDKIENDISTTNHEQEPTIQQFTTEQKCARCKDLHFSDTENAITPTPLVPVHSNRRTIPKQNKTSRSVINQSSLNYISMINNDKNTSYKSNNRMNYPKNIKNENMLNPVTADNHSESNMNGVYDTQNLIADTYNRMPSLRSLYEKKILI